MARLITYFALFSMLPPLFQESSELQDDQDTVSDPEDQEYELSIRIDDGPLSTRLFL